MHWFDWRQAHHEFARILRPDGWVLIVTNGHSEGGAPVSEMLAAFIRRWRDDAPEGKRKPDFNERLPGFLDASTWLRARLYDAMMVDFAALLGYLESLSAMPRAGDGGYEDMVSELRGTFDRFQQQGVLEIPLECELFLGHLQTAYGLPEP
jgi:hypothetical protein